MEKKIMNDNHENISRCVYMSLFDPRCHWLYIVAPRYIQMKPDYCSWAKLPMPMVISRCM